MEYVDLSRPGVRESQATLVADVAQRALLYPVTFVDGSPVYDGAVSYPAILRAVEAATA